MYKHVFKRAFDLLVALVALPFFGLLLLVVAPLLYLSDKGPIFYCGERVGQHGRIFKMIKFRSMRVNAPDIRLADGSTYNGEDDPRVFGFGKILRATSIDEVPQILNILKGDMSLIGERGIIETTKNNADFSRVVTVNSISL